jgi:hypothetical protein
MINLRGSIPSFILITDGKYHDSNALDVIGYQPDAIYLMDKAYVDFDALFCLNQAGAYFVTRAKAPMKYRIVEQNGNIDDSVGLRADKTIVLSGYKFYFNR